MKEILFSMNKGDFFIEILTIKQHKNALNFDPLFGCINGLVGTLRYFY